MQLEIFKHTDTREVNAISWQQAKAINEIAELKNTLDKLKETARYLYGKKRGAWGRMTQADEKRSNKIDNLNFKIKNKIAQYEAIFNTTF